eukprot:13310-Pelagococcus_subviridis.AAC.5
MRTGAAGAVCVKHLAVKGAKSVAFIGTGVIAESMARSTATVYGFEQGYGYSRNIDKATAFCDKMQKELGYDFKACDSAEEAVRNADVVFTQTPGGEWVLDLAWLKPHATIIASGSDQPTKNEIPPEVMKKAKVITDITAQCVRVGEVRSAVAAGVMKESDVHAELGEIINGSKKGRQGKELIVCDLTGTGAQDAAIGSYVMNRLFLLYTPKTSIRLNFHPRAIAPPRATHTETRAARASYRVGGGAGASLLAFLFSPVSLLFPPRVVVAAGSIPRSEVMSLFSKRSERALASGLARASVGLGSSSMRTPRPRPRGRPFLRPAPASVGAASRKGGRQRRAAIVASHEKRAVPSKHTDGAADSARAHSSRGRAGVISTS